MLLPGNHYEQVRTANAAFLLASPIVKKIVALIVNIGKQ